MIPNALYVICSLLALVFLGLYLIRKTPYGLLDVREAILLKVVPERDLDRPLEVQRSEMRKKAERFLKTNMDIRRIEDKTIPVDGPATAIPIRIYSDHQESGLPILVYFHGGGWVVCDIETHDGICRRLARAAKTIVVSVGYRLSPEHPYPVPLNDSYDALTWVRDNASSIGGDPKKIAVGGDSAGGNLAAAVALKARDEKGPAIGSQVLVYPVMDLSKLTTASYKNFKKGFSLTKAQMEQFIDRYTPDAAVRKHPYVSPLLAEKVADLPPALIITAGFDPLRDEAEQYGKRLEAAGVPTTMTRYQGTIHGFFGVAALGKNGMGAIKEVGKYLTDVFED